MTSTIILRDWQIRALKEGRLSQVRVLHSPNLMVGPPFEAGAVLRVREGWTFGDGMNPEGDPARPTWRADWPDAAVRWRSPAEMPARLARFSLTVVGRPTLQQVREMTEADAVACGAKHWPDIPGAGSRWSCDVPANTDQCLGTARFAFANRWIRDLGEKPHEDNVWERNAWTWRIEVRA